MVMEYSFSFGWFFVGILVTAAGALVVKFFQQVTNMIGRGVEFYDKVKLAGVIACAAGILIALNIHMFVIGFIVNLVFGGVFGTK